MSGIQMHHAKLWFAGQNENWPLADFEIHEILEALEDIQKFCVDRPESKSIGMINPAIDSISYAIQQKNLQLFKNSFTLLTNTCNNCHKATEHGFVGTEWTTGVHHVIRAPGCTYTQGCTVLPCPTPTSSPSAAPFLARPSSSARRFGREGSALPSFPARPFPEQRRSSASTAACSTITRCSDRRCRRSPSVDR